MALYIIIALVALVVGGVSAVVILFLAVNLGKRKRKKPDGAQISKTVRRKLEFSKIVLALVLMTYFVGVVIGVKISLIDISQLGVLLAYIGTPTAAAIGFYCWKAKAENIVKIKRENPEETQGIPVDLNNIDHTV